MTAPRGLTLLETLAATVILSLIAVACIPMLQDARASLEQPSAPACDLIELALLADAVMADPKAHGLDAWPNFEGAVLQWPEETVQREPQLALRPVQVTVLTPSIDDPGQHERRHQWVSFMCDGVGVLRWTAVAEAQEVQP